MRGKAGSIEFISQNPFDLFVITFYFTVFGFGSFFERKMHCAKFHELYICV